MAAALRDNRRMTDAHDSIRTADYIASAGYPHATAHMAHAVAGAAHVYTRDRGPAMVRLLTEVGITDLEYHSESCSLVGDVPASLRRELMMVEALSFVDDNRRPRPERDHCRPLWRLDGTVGKLLAYLEARPDEYRLYVEYLRAKHSISVDAIGAELEP